MTDHPIKVPAKIPAMKQQVLKDVCQYPTVGMFHLVCPPMSHKILTMELSKTRKAVSLFVNGVNELQSDSDKYRSPVEFYSFNQCGAVYGILVVSPLIYPPKWNNFISDLKACSKHYSLETLPAQTSPNGQFTIDAPGFITRGWIKPSMLDMLKQRQIDVKTVPSVKMTEQEHKDAIDVQPTTSANVSVGTPCVGSTNSSQCSDVSMKRRRIKILQTQVPLQIATSDEDAPLRPLPAPAKLIRPTSYGQPFTHQVIAPEIVIKKEYDDEPTLKRVGGQAYCEYLDEMRQRYGKPDGEISLEPEEEEDVYSITADSIDVPDSYSDSTTE